MIRVSAGPSNGSMVPKTDRECEDLLLYVKEPDDTWPSDHPDLETS